VGTVFSLRTSSPFSLTGIIFLLACLLSFVEYGKVYTSLFSFLIVTRRGIFFYSFGTIWKCELATTLLVYRYAVSKLDQ